MADFISIDEAAERIEAKPGDVHRLLDAGELRQVVLVDADSLAEYQEQQ